MDYKVLYRKYRPKNFSELMGQDNIKELLINSIINEKLSHAYIFTGPRGTGKTSSAKIFAKTVNCENLTDSTPCEECSFCLSADESPDIIEIDAASNNGIDEIREIRENIKILPNYARYKIYIIDEVHMLSSSAWNAFLKTLEEPPNHVIFILATTEIQKVPITVLSRCQRFDFQKISEPVIAEMIKKIAKSEKINITEEAINEISILAEGGLRDALSILDQLSKLNNKITLTTLKKAYGIVSAEEIKVLFNNYLSNNIELFLNQIDKFQHSGVDSSILISKMLEYLLNEYIENKINNTCEFDNIESLISDLESCYYKSNQYVLIKTYLLKNINKQQIEEIKKETPVIIENNSQEISTNTVENINNEIFDIRINNSFVNAKIELKKEFIKNWKCLLKTLFEKNDHKLEALLKETDVEVVSPTNVILSTESYSNSVLLNSMSDQISLILEKEFNISVKIVCLDINNWKKTKSEYIKNCKTKKYQFIEEPEQIISEEVINSAETLFGNELVEIK